jgi:hypothetical protein
MVVGFVPKSNIVVYIDFVYLSLIICLFTQYPNCKTWSWHSIKICKHYNRGFCNHDTCFPVVTGQPIMYKLLHYWVFTFWYWNQTFWWLSHHVLSSTWIFHLNLLGKIVHPDRVEAIMKLFCRICGDWSIIWEYVCSFFWNLNSYISVLFLTYWWWYFLHAACCILYLLFNTGEYCRCIDNWQYFHSCFIK